MRNAELLHREIQAKWRMRTALAHRFSAIRQIPSNYQRYFVWSIENASHYVRDVTFEEDAYRIRKNSDIIARLRSFANNLLGNKFDVENYKNARCRAALAINFLLEMPNIC